MTEPEWGTIEVPLGSLADEIALRWGGASDVEKVIEFARDLWGSDPELALSLFRSASRTSRAQRARVAAAWDKWS